MLERDKIAAAQRLHERARQLRGRFLNYVAAIEHEIGIVLTIYFCVDDDEKRASFFDGIVENLTLQRKKEIIVEILKNDYPHYWEENKDTFLKLEIIQTFRNKLAHSVVDVSDEALARAP